MSLKSVTLPLLEASCRQTGASTRADAMGMREMQARAYAKRNEQYLLIKAPPASGKSRALMFIALDKLAHQGIKKVIVSVPQIEIGSSFKDTPLSKNGFFTDWHISDGYDLSYGSDDSKAGKVLKFLRDDKACCLLCPHATLRNAFDRLKMENSLHLLDKALLAIDEFHHVSEEQDNRLGGLLGEVMRSTTAHIVAMTGSYFRGDRVPILSSEDEARFSKVVYTYYEQLNGYKYLKSLGIGYHFYQGSYLSAIGEVLDTSKKTIVHIPNVNSSESTSNKYDEGWSIIETIGNIEKIDPETGIFHVRTKDRRLLKVANLIDDRDPKLRTAAQNYLRNIKDRDGIDIILALNMAKEGFDWPWCEHVLTVGYRSSLTEVVQIIGRATRDCEGKTRAQFTNLIAAPDAEQQDVAESVNNLLKAIAFSLLMRDVLAPCITFRHRQSLKPGEEIPAGTVVIDEEPNHPMSEYGRKVLESGDLQEIVTDIYQDPEMMKRGVIANGSAQVIELEIPRVIRSHYPELTDNDIMYIHNAVKAMIIKKTASNYADQVKLLGFDDEGGASGVCAGVACGTEGAGGNGGDGGPQIIVSHTGGPEDEAVSGRGLRSGLLEDSARFLNVDQIDLDLIYKINPFREAYEIISKNLNSERLKAIQDKLEEADRRKSGCASDMCFDESELLKLWPRIREFTQNYGHQPCPNSGDSLEEMLWQALQQLRKLKAEHMAREAGGNAAADGAVSAGAGAAAAGAPSAVK